MRVCWMWVSEAVCGSWEECACVGCGSRRLCVVDGGGTRWRECRVSSEGARGNTGRAGRGYETEVGHVGYVARGIKCV